MTDRIQAVSGPERVDRREGERRERERRAQQAAAKALVPAPLTEAEAEVRSCPQLSVLGLDAVAGTVVEPTDVAGQAPEEVVLRLEASTSHPERTCEIRIIITSEGDGASRSTTVDVDVKAADPEDVVGDTNDVGTSNPSSPADDSPMPLPSSVLIVAVFLAFLRVPRRPENF